MARWSVQHELPNPTQQKLDLRVPNQGPDWQLLLFPLYQLHKAAGGFGPICVYNHIVIAVPFPKPEAKFDLFIGALGMSRLCMLD